MQTNEAHGSEAPRASTERSRFIQSRGSIAKALSRYLDSKHAPFLFFILLAPYAIVVAFNDKVFAMVYGQVIAGPWGAAIAVLVGFVLAWLDFQVLKWVLRTKFLCGRYRKALGISLYFFPSVIWITLWMLSAAGLRVGTLPIAWCWPRLDVLLTTTLMALFFVLFYGPILKLASPAFSKLDYTVFHSALDKMMHIIDDCQAEKLDIGELEGRERVCTEVLDLLAQTQTCLENNVSIEADRRARESIRILLQDLRKMKDELQELEGRKLTKQQLRLALGESERNWRFRQVRNGECLC